MNMKRESYFEQARETLLYTGGRLYSMRDHPRISNLQVSVQEYQAMRTKGSMWQQSSGGGISM